MDASKINGGHGEPPTARHRLPANLAAALRAARLSQGLGLRQLERRAKISRGYLSDLEHGNRCPSVELARVLIETLDLGPDAMDQLLRVARPNVGRSRRTQIAMIGARD